MGWGWEEGSRREEIYVFSQLIHFVAQQKLSQYCKTIIKKKKRKTAVKAEWEDLAADLLQRVRKGVQPKMSGSLDGWETAVQLRRTRKSEGGEFAGRQFCF